MTLDLDSLRARVSGPVYVPNDEGFAAAVTGFNLRAAYAPDAAVAVQSEADVVEAVRFAAENGMLVAVQATGHGATGTLIGGLLILTAALDSVSIDGAIATVGAGARWKSVVDAAGSLGLAAITGSSPDVGAVGYLLGGGLGPLSRSHGFSSDYVRSFRVVTGTGELVTASASEHPDLFWALRGGKAGFGVVTSADVELVPLAEIYGGSLFFATEHIEAALRGWIAWTHTADPEVSTSIAIMRFPPFDAVPEPLRGQTLFNLRFAYPGDSERGEQLAAPLRALAPVMMDLLGSMPTTKMGMIHNDPSDPSPSWVVGAMFDRADNELASAILTAAGANANAPVVAVEVRHLGSRTAVDVAEGSAVGGRDAAYTFNIIAVPNPHAPVPAIEAYWQAFSAAIAPWRSPVTTINFAGEPPADRLKDSWSPEIYARIQEVQKVYDPAGSFAWGRQAG